MSKQRSAQQDGITGHILGELDPSVWFSHRLDTTRKPFLTGARDAAAAYLEATEQGHIDANQDWQIEGTNAAEADVTHDVDNPGLIFATAGAASDTIAIGPQEFANQSLLGAMEWDTSKELIFQSVIRSPATITPDMILTGGYFLTLDNITDFAPGNDADGFFFRYENGVNSGRFEIIMNFGTSSIVVDSKITVAVNTQYKISLRLTADRTLQAVINDEVVLAAGDSSVMDADTDLKPHLGVGETVGGAGAARSFTLHDLLVARKIV